MMITCATCDRPFEPNKQGRFCHPCRKARQKARRGAVAPRHEVDCRECGERFTRTSADPRTCHRCRWRRRVDRQARATHACACGRIVSISHVQCKLCRDGAEVYRARKVLERVRRKIRLGRPLDAQTVERAAKAEAILAQRTNSRASHLQSMRAQREARVHEIDRRRQLVALADLLAKLQVTREEEAAAAALGLTVKKMRWRQTYADPEFRAVHIARARANAHRRSEHGNRAKDGSLSPAAVRALLERTTRCYYCRKRLARHARTVDHIVPMVAGGMHSLLNVVVACQPCNSRKNARPIESVLPAGAQLPLLMEAAA